MSLVKNTTNIDYLIPDVRLRLGDLDKTSFTDIVVRTALIMGVKFLQSKWHRRYLVYTSTMLIIPQPSDVPAGYVYVNLPEGANYIPSGLNSYDVFRNPFVTFTDTSSSVIVQEDEYPVTIAGLLFLRESILSGTQQTFVNWTDGEYSYSNVASSKVMADLSKSALDELNAFFKSKRAGVLRDSFANFVI